MRTMGTPMPSAMRCAWAWKSPMTWPGSIRTNSVTGGPGSAECSCGAEVQGIPAALRLCQTSLAPSTVSDHCQPSTVVHHAKRWASRRRRSQSHGAHRGRDVTNPVYRSCTRTVVGVVGTMVTVLPSCRGWVLARRFGAAWVGGDGRRSGHAPDWATDQQLSTDFAEVGELFLA